MGGGYQRFGGFALQARQVDVQFDLQAEAAGNLADADLAGYRGVGGKGLLALAGNELQGSDEAGGVAGGEQLFRVGGRAALAAQFARSAEFHIEHAVRGYRTAVTASGGGCGCGVESLDGLHEGHLSDLYVKFLRAK